MAGKYGRVTTVVAEYADFKYRALLLPVWIYAFRFQDNIYRVTVNGQTGEVQGEYPISNWKRAFAFIAKVIMIGGFFGFFGWLTVLSLRQ